MHVNNSLMSAFTANGVSGTYKDDAKPMVRPSSGLQPAAQNNQPLKDTVTITGGTETKPSNNALKNGSATVQNSGSAAGTTQNATQQPPNQSAGAAQGQAKKVPQTMLDLLA